MLEVAADHPKALKDPAPQLFCVGFGDSSINFELAVWSAEMTTAPRRFRSDLFFALEKKLRENNIEIPFPQREIRMRAADASNAFQAAPRTRDSDPNTARP
jgi:small-conductance mechanosensitive channel